MNDINLMFFVLTMDQFQATVPFLYPLKTSENQLKWNFMRELLTAESRYTIFL